tara:strand:- start:156 stop:1040 length:885 start_codon:yes stop_codon:yes gene_type:complete
MPTIVNAPFRSKFGYDSPSFTVDSAGNITARSITLDVSDNNVEIAADFKFQDTTGNFRLINNLIDNPSITIVRNTGNTIDLDLTNFTFNIFDSIGGTVTLYNSGLRHTDGTVDSDAQGKASGRLYITPSVATPDTLYYGNAAGTIYGIVNVTDPTGTFGTVAVNTTTESTSSTTGALVVAGGVGVAGDLYVAGSLNIDGLGITKISSSTNLELEATNEIVVKIDGSKLGIIKSTGSSVPVEDTTINNTTIGAVVPSAAAFTSATVSTEPAELNAIANKKYVDRTATALSIAFGL